MEDEYPALASAVMEKIRQDKGAAAAIEEIHRLGPLVVLSDRVLVGGYGFDGQLRPGDHCDLHFTTEGLWVLNKYNVRRTSNW